MKIAIITGLAQGIGLALADGFRDAGYEVFGIDIQPNPCFSGDLSDKADLDAFLAAIYERFDKIDLLINNAMVGDGGLLDSDYERFNRVLRLGISAPFYLVRQLQDRFSENASVINILSTRINQSQANTESYSAAKGGLQALSHAMMVTLAGKIRVNSIVPGWIDTQASELSDADRRQHPAGRVGAPRDIVNAALFLANPENDFINGEELFIDGGMSKLMIYHGDEGWSLTSET